MTISDVCYLITAPTAPRGVHDRPVETERMVYCQVSSVGRSEFYQANMAGMNPEWILRLSDTVEYQGEMFLRFRGDRWRILRTYMTNDGGLELTIQRTDTVTDAGEG